MNKNTIYAFIIAGLIIVSSNGMYHLSMNSGINQSHIDDMIDLEEIAADALPENKVKKEKTADQLVKQCLTCHTFTASGKNKTGPNLYNVYMQKIASNDSFKYSESFKQRDFLWSDDNLDKLLESPKKFIPKTKMTFNGFKKPEERAKVIQYLKSLN